MPIELVVASAIIFGPTSGWLARRAGRWPVGWLVLGALIGPIAPFLILVAPPARCPLCDEPSRGFGGTCPTCGHRYGPMVGWQRDDVASEDSIRPADGAPAAGPPSGPASSSSTGLAGPERADRGPGTEIPATPAGASSPSRRGSPGIRDRNGRDAAGPMPTDPGLPRRQPVERPADAGRVEVASGSAGTAREILAYGVYVSGSARIPIGSRYAIALQGPDLVIQGPLDTDPLGIAVRHARASLDASLVNDHLLISGGTRGRADFMLAFMSVGLAPGHDLREIGASVGETPADAAPGGEARSTDLPGGGEAAR